MSFINPNAFYEEELLLLEKGTSIPTTITEGQVVNGDLTPFRHRMEAVNTGNQLQNNGILILRVPPDGTFVRKEPILIDESAKDDYIIQFRIKQDRDKDGVFEEEGKLFRFFIGQPTLQDDEFVGETLKINLIPVEYRTRETVDAERSNDTASDRRDPFLTPKKMFERRALAYNTIKGSENTALFFTTGETGSIQLPDADSLRQEYRPLAPTPTHDLFKEIVARQSLSGVEGGVFEDFFFDYDAVESDTQIVQLRAEAEGTVDSGVVLDPLVFETSDTQKDNEINVDLIKFKNNVIAQGNPQGGSLPREHTVFSSIFEHAKLRPEWDPTRAYTNGENNTEQNEVRITDPFLEQVRFFKAINANAGINPTSDPNRADVWEEDFVTIPDYDNEASYNGKPLGITTRKGDIVVQVGIGGIDRFYEAIQDVPANPQDDITFVPQPGGTAFWADTGVTFLRGDKHPLFDSTATTGLDRVGRTQFFSYTPWTQDFKAMRQSSLFGIENGTSEGTFEQKGYQGVIPDWNYVRANFDRVVSDSRFELVAGKDVQKLVFNPGSIAVGDRHFGNRWLLTASPTGIFSGHGNQVAEWVGKDFDPTGLEEEDFRFSRDPLEGETVIDRSTGRWLTFDATLNAWIILWNITDDGTGGAVDDSLLQQIKKGLETILPRFFGFAGILVSFLFDKNTFGDTTVHSPLHIVKDIKLVEGASGIPGQAYEMRYNWSAVESVTIGGIKVPIAGADKKNFSSVGAWWFMMFPYPKIEGFGRDVGDVYKNPFIDSNNLNKNHLGDFGWNEGLDSEDLGRIQRISFKARLSLFGSVTGGLVLGYSDMPMKFWAVDIFDRIWYADFKIRRNGEYSLVQLSFGDNSIRQLHFGRYDELLEIYGIVLDTNWTLREKEFTGIEFDWRFVKSMGMFYDVGYNSQGLYVANQFPDYVKNIAEQMAGQAFNLLISVNVQQEEYQATDLLVNNTRLAVDELHFEKQLYANSDRTKISNARTEIAHLASEVDYLNLRLRAQAVRERRKFVEQAWFMQAHGDVRLRFGEKFTAEGPRVPTGTQDLICNEVKHIIDSDGYMMQLTGKRKFILES